ncbi:alpha/beta fold hydrolase [Sphingomonas sp.]|uniref:alpha/beta fold hydrolase n=1 Tax=Sphingomonas sp. TaxID=28214 RepID=UPI003B0042B8
MVYDGDEGRLSEASFLNDFAGDVPRDRARILYAVQQPFRRALVAEKTTIAAWRSKPSYYAVSTEDRTIDPAFERFMAKRMKAHTIELRSSHLSPVSHSREISDLISLAASRA